MKNIAIMAMSSIAIGSQAHKLGFIEDADGISLAAIRYNGQEMI